MEKINDADVQHREQFQDYVIYESRPWHREHLGRLYLRWDEWNEQYFEDRLVTPYVWLAEPGSPQRLGDYAGVSGFGGHGQIRIRPSLLTGRHAGVRSGEKYAEGRFRLVADVFLHETIHQWQHEVLGDWEDGYHGHGPQFRDQCNRIGAMLGLPPVRTSKARGKDQALPSCAHWPHCVRPPEYYLGAYPADRAVTGGGGVRSLEAAWRKAGQQERAQFAAGHWPELVVAAKVKRLAVG
jgi:hypothetical protein